MLVKLNFEEMRYRNRNEGTYLYSTLLLRILGDLCKKV
jgi:hypothetical protein